MFKTNFFLNPKRKFEILNQSLLKKILLIFKNKIAWLWVYFGFVNINYSYVHGDKKRLLIGKGCSTMNSIFNVISGNIIIGDNTIFGHNCMVLTGTHNFKNGKRISLNNNFDDKDETPSYGRDVVIGSGCFIGSGVIIIGPLKIGDNVIIGSGSIVTKSLNGGAFYAGNPAKKIKSIG